MSRQKFQICAFAMIALGMPVWNQAQRPRYVTREVNVYFWGSEESGPPEMFGLAPVLRRVSRVTPARGALEALITGPTADERARGLRAPHSEGLSIKTLTIEKGVARLSLISDCPQCPRWSGTLGPPRFRKAIELTLKQFSGVRAVKICLDGYEDFDELREKKCQW
jgi:sporulation and spore germination protein